MSMHNDLENELSTQASRNEGAIYDGILPCIYIYIYKQNAYFS